MNRLISTIAILLGLLLASCATEPRYNPYQQETETGQGQDSAVAELQRNAVDALDRQASQQAIDFLQRAIRIEPRNPLSWHYLAQAYWLRKDYARCLEMVERSFSYSSSEDGLDQANSQLKARCQPG